MLFLVHLGAGEMRATRRVFDPAKTNLENLRAARREGERALKEGWEWCLIGEASA